METLSQDYYLSQEKLPHSWCPGCGYGIIIGSITRAMASLNMRAENTLVTTGIGCWGKSDDILNTNRLHTTHGRAIAFATGVSLNKPDMNIITLVGDGDGATIGGNHLIHAAKRNINMTVIMADNLLYGQTGGQYSATTPYNSITSTSQFGNPEPSLNVCDVVKAAGANFVARGSAYHINMLDNLIKQAMSVKGFSFVEVISPCPAHYGRKNNLRKTTSLMNWIKDYAVSMKIYEQMSPENQKEHVPIGVFVNKNEPDFLSRYETIRKKINCKLEAENER